MFIVVISSQLYGDCVAIAHAITSEFITVEMSYEPPRGSELNVHFLNPDELAASMCGVSEAVGTSDRKQVLRFKRFIDAPPYAMWAPE